MTTKELRRCREQFDAAKRFVEKNAPRVIGELLRQTVSLRALAQMAGLSPTYLSQVRNGKTPCSWSAYMTLSTLAEQRR